MAVLVHPAVVLRRRRRAPWSVSLACSFVSVTSALGYLLYPEYRARLRQHLFQEAPRIAWLFERKEHLAFGALALAWAGAAAYVASRREGDELARTFRRIACLSFAASALLAGVVASSGIAVAVTRSF